MPRKSAATSKRRTSSRRRNNSGGKFSRQELVVVKDGGQLYLARITKVIKTDDSYDIEYVDYANQYTENVSGKKLTKYSVAKHKKLVKTPRKKQLKALAKQQKNSSTFFYNCQEKLTFVTMFSNSKRYNFVCSLACILVGVCFIAETTESTAYGRFGNDSTIGLDPRIGWWLMELPCSTFFVYNFWLVGGPQQNNTVPKILASIFTLHYLYRGWIFPSMIKVHNGSKNFSIIPAVFSWLVTVTHA